MAGQRGTYGIVGNGTMADCSESSEVLFEASELGGVSKETRPLLQRKFEEKKDARKRKLGMIFGVTIPCILSIFSVILFLRLGFVLGQAGFLQTLGMLVIGYGVVVLTVLSISAIATNGNVEGGGVYFMISRALGPEFGGSVGVIFFVANVFASATYIIGFVEALLNNLGKGGNLIHCANSTDCFGFPDGYGYQLLYGSIVLLFCLVVCLVGAGLFAKTSFFIFLAVMFSIFTVMFSFGFVEFRSIRVDNNQYASQQNITLVNYTGFNFHTFVGNLWGNYTIDYTQFHEGSETSENNHLTFEAVFAILFNGCTGIMAGANISGDLKNPSTSIPQGTLLACGLTFFIYIILFTFSAFTCDRALLQNDYNYLQNINVQPWLITIGVIAATLSAALSTLIGASRVLQALAKDRLFSGILHPFTWTVGKKKEPIVAVLFSWLLVQLTLLIGQLNTIAPFVTMFFLVSYCVVNLACLALKFASAPNFRPTFQFYAKYTSFVGALGCAVLMFVIEPLYAAVTVALMVILFGYLLLRAPATPWGDVSQALIYHQVRKFLLRLDIRKSHVKFWRPEILLMVSNPRSSYRLIQFCNDLKKGGLYVLGHVMVQPFSRDIAEIHNKQLKLWLDLVQISKVKAFVELTISDSVRNGARNLLTCAGLGGMKPNILALGFFSDDLPHSCLTDLQQSLNKRSSVIRKLIRDESLSMYDNMCIELPPLRRSAEERCLTEEDYVGMIHDALVVEKNVCIMRYFERFTPKPHGHSFIDVWPLQVRFNEEFDYTFTMVLQLACVLHMKGDWTSTRIRIFIVLMSGSKGQAEREIMTEFLREARIDAYVHVLPHLGGDAMFSTWTESLTAQVREGRGMDYYSRMNVLMKQHSDDARVIFTSLPPPPDDIQTCSKSYVKELDALTNDLPPTVMVYGTTPVMSSSL